MGARGPAPKRDGERRRVNKPEVETTVVDIGALIRQDVEVPVADGEWHPIAAMLYNSFAKSGQAKFYEPTDWAVLYFVAESISRDLEEQFVGFQGTGEGRSEPVYATIPMKGASLGAYLKAFSALMATEGDRRRVRMELERAKNLEGKGEGGPAVDIGSARSRHL